MKYAWIVLIFLSGCATQRTLCEDLSPFECEKLEHQMHPAMKPIFSPHLEEK